MGKLLVVVSTRKEFAWCDSPCVMDVHGSTLGPTRVFGTTSIQEGIKLELSLMSKLEPKSGQRKSVYFFL